MSPILCNQHLILIQKQVDQQVIDVGGVYLVYTKADADIRIEDGYYGYVTDHVYNLSSNSFTTIVHITQNETTMTLAFYNTTGRDLEESRDNIINLMLIHLSHFSIIRFMEWLNTIHIPKSNWNKTKPFLMTK